MPEQQLMDGQALKLAIARIAHEIAEDMNGTDVVVLGIQAGGVQLATRVADELGKLWNKDIPAGTIDGGMHRDDLPNRGAAPLHHTEIPEEMEGKVVILTDDVIASGRTVRASLDALNSFGRPSHVRLAVLIDRGSRELPIQPDYCGRKIDAASEEHINVKWLEVHGEDAVYVDQT
ncbi:MAG: bifunctional pyr operon transcriptional regulator/uracil phosphoribosyltransferase PyrR [Limisphaerales bacterium]